jgi:branched-chain amino acid transport system ATP-binding protein
VLELRDLVCRYGKVAAVKGISLHVERGQLVALIGTNGAGKTTTLKAIMGLLPSVSGEIAFNGRRIEALPSFEIARLGLGYVPEDRRIFAGLSVMENLEVGRQRTRTGLPSWTPEKLFELFPNLARMRSRRGAEMSGGEQQMLAIARTLMGNPCAILLDEPFEGLAPRIVEGIATTVRALKSAGLAVLLCEQNPRYAGLVGADRAVTLEKGQVRADAAQVA